MPNEVLTKDDYAIVMDASRPLDERKAAFASRARWIAPLGRTSYTDQINNMIVGFDHLGVVEAREGPRDTDVFPAVIEVEDQHKPIPDVVPKAALAQVFRGAAQVGAASPAREVDISVIEKVRRFPSGLPPRLR